MTTETETVLDRRRLRRNMAFWRALAVFAAIFAIGAALFSSSNFKSLIGQKQIARVSITGTILEDRKQLKLLDKIEESDNVAAMILFVNSPGGTTTGGEAIYQALRRISKKKPVVAQFGTVAASAGYIVGLGTDHIVSRGNTITGSVGVILQWPQVTDLLDKIGVKVNEIKSGPLKAEPSPFGTLNEDARKITEEMVQSSFRWFVSLVEERRGIKAPDVPGLMGGRVFSGRDAKKFDLVDEIGGEEEAVRWLETERGVAKGLDIVDWKPSDAQRFGLSSLVYGAASSLIGNKAGGLLDMMARDRQLSTLGLDGMVSVWHPSEN
ncbi:MAG: signal peptide peptidase SppA [Pseudomonadota bacterium]